MHIYIHIPFCTSKCPYCAFGSSADSFDLVKSYFEALSLEIDNAKLSNIKTIFIGGGTPSSINANFYEEIFTKLSQFIDENTEITTEANPNSANLKWLLKMKSYGVNRVSFGTQSFNDEKLKLLDRNHNATHTKKAVENAKKAGFENINLDIIYSTKFDDRKLLLSEIANLKELELTHISAYSLILEENTPFENKFEYLNDDVDNARFLFSELENAGFKQYEISNFGRVCKHNLAYWEGKNYLGLGAYSVGFDTSRRYYAHESIKEYIKNPLFRKVEELTKEELKLERLFLGFRSCVGVNAGLLNESELKKAKILVVEEKLEFKNETFYNRNFLLSDEIVLFISDDFTRN
ncbi:MAG: coproporphyrinogen III oxidase family protein [Campylobacteraceae bacterium]|nr:coproporphyrinogen III oxidase family protein [Campylobacteraceae bacterium]